MLRDLYRLLARTPQESLALSAIGPRLLKGTAFMIVLGLFLALLLPSLARELGEMRSARVSVAVPRAEWKTFVGPHGGCEVTPLAKSCPAHPGNLALWQSPLRLGDRDHPERVKAAGKAPYFIGAVIPVEGLRQALAERANAILIGSFSADVAIYVDGQLMLSEEGQSLRGPAAIVLPLERLSQAKPLLIAARITNTVGSPHPDGLTGPFGDPGLIPVRGLEAMRAADVWNSDLRPAAALLFYGFVAMLFFGLWLVAPKKQEFVHLATLAALIACENALISRTVYTTMSRESLYLLLTAIAIAQGGAALILGMALCRVKLAIMGSVGAVTLMVCGMIAGYSVTSHQIFSLLGVAYRGWKPLGYWLGGTLCILFSVHLARVRTSAPLRIPFKLGRVHLLRRLGISMLVLAIIAWVSSSAAMSSTSVYVWPTLAPISVFFWMSYLVVREFGELWRTVETTPISKFHKMDPLPERLEGLILEVDLKNSECLHRKGKAIGNPDQYVSQIISGLWKVGDRNGGVVMATVGDLIRVYFDIHGSEALGDALERAVRTFEQMAAETELSRKQLLDAGVLDPGETVGIRGAIALGEVRPVFTGESGSRLAAWFNAGSTEPFVEVARLNQIESRLTATAKLPSMNNLIVMEKLLESAPADIQGRFPLRDIQAEAKHGNQLRVSVLPFETAA
jgi:hypothetical protein